MVDETGQTSPASGINDVVVVHTKEVATPNAGGLISALSDISYTLPYYFSYILYHHLICSDGLHGKQSPVVNGGLGKLQQLLPGLERENRVTFLPDFFD